MHQPGYESSIELLWLLVFVCLFFALSSAFVGFYTWAGAAGVVLAILGPYAIGYSRADGFASAHLERVRKCGRAVRDFARQHGRYPDESDFDSLAQEYDLPVSTVSRCAIVHYAKPPTDAPGDYIVLKCHLRARILGPLSLKAVIELQKNGTLRRR